MSANVIPHPNPHGETSTLSTGQEGLQPPIQFSVEQSAYEQNFPSFNPVEAGMVPQTPQEITERWGKLQGGWQRFKGAVSGAIGRAKATLNGEAYDPAAHNRTVQNQLYQHLGKAGVSELLAAKDNRYQRYVDGRVGRAEKARATAMIATAIVPAAVGLVAWRGASSLLKGSAATSELWTAVANEGSERRAAKAVRRRQREEKAWETPRTANERALVVHYHEQRKKNPGPSAEELARIRQDHELIWGKKAA